MKKELNVFIGNKIKQYRRSLKLTQDDLANIIGCDRVTVSNIEEAKNGTTVLRLFQISAALNIPIINLLPGVDDYKPVIKSVSDFKRDKVQAKIKQLEKKLEFLKSA